MPTQKLVTDFFTSRVSANSSIDEDTAAVLSPALGTDEPGHRTKRQRASKSREASVRDTAKSSSSKEGAATAIPAPGTTEPGHRMTRRRASKSQEASARGNDAGSSSVKEGATTATVSPASGTDQPGHRAQRQRALKSREASVRAKTAKTAARADISDYESELDLDTSKSTIDETMTSLTSFAETPAKEVDVGKVSPPLPTPGSVGPQRPRRSAFAAAEASIKRSYEEYGQSLAEATEAVKKARTELPAITLPAKRAKAEADDKDGQISTSGSPRNRRSSRRASARAARNKEKAPATPASSHASLDEQDSEAEPPLSDYEDAAASRSGNDNDGDWDEESQCVPVSDEEFENDWDEESQCVLASHEEFEDEFPLHNASRDVLHGIDPLDLIPDDEYVVLEGEDEDDYDVPFDDVTVDDDNTGTSKPLHKKSRVVLADVNAPEWVADFNASHPVESDDEDLLRFDCAFTDLVKQFTDWSTDGDIARWYRLPRAEREMTIGSRVMLQKASRNFADFTRILLEGMPLEVRKILGSKDSCPKKFLDLPIVPWTWKHRMVYMDVSTNVGEEQIHQVSKGYNNGRLFKEPKPSCDLKQASQVKLYVGSSVNKDGGAARVKQHLALINGHRKMTHRQMGMHYKECTKPGVVSNFRMLGAWQNPFADGSYDGQDVSRWIPAFVEGLIIVYLGLYTRKHIVADLPLIFPVHSFDLVERIRDIVSLPDFSNISLNRAWPLCQGISSNNKSVERCANPECQRPRVVSEDTLIGTRPTMDFRQPMYADLLSPYYCNNCCDHHRGTGGEVRTREGLPTGRWEHEMDFDAINNAWLASKGRQRQCGNLECGVRIHRDANLYGVENGIRCLRCFTYARSFYKDYSPSDGESVKTGDCQVCHKKNAPLLSWTKVSRRKKHDADLPSELCDKCYSRRCSFLQDTVPKDPQPRTIAGCGNPACFSPETRGQEKRAKKGFRVLIENIDEHVWRCLRCDYCHEAGVNSFIKTKGYRVPKPPTGPIPSHRFNATSCIDCERYVSYRRWEKVEGGYRCASCVGQRCADCDVDPAFSTLTRNSDGLRRCHDCVLGRAKTLPGGLEPDGSGITRSRKCCNTHCNATEKDTTRWCRDREDKSLYRCRRCDDFLSRHGTEWYGVTKCYNESCDAAGPDIQWNTCSDGNIRCIPCRTAFVVSGKDRDCKARCHNYDFCKNDFTSYSGKFFRDTKDGHTRCVVCQKLWYKNGRQYERGVTFPRLDKAQREARICSRPGCNANHHTCKGEFHRWFEFTSDGWVCGPCFKELRMQQSNSTAREAGPAAAGDSDEDANAHGDELE